MASGISGAACSDAQQGVFVDPSNMTIRDGASRAVRLQLMGDENLYLPLHGAKIDHRTRVSVADITPGHVLIAPALDIALAVHGAVRATCERYYGMCCNSGGASVPGVRMAIEGAGAIVLDGKPVRPEAL